MKKIIVLLLTIAVIAGLVSTATFAFFSDIETSPPGATTVCAVAVRSFDQGTTAGGGSVDGNRSDPTAALGEPDGELGDFVSLGFGGSIVLDFGTYVCGEVTIWEVTWGGDYPLEEAVVEAIIEASPDGESWTELVPHADNTTDIPENAKIHPTPISLGGEHIRYIRITDTSDPALHDDDADAFDLTAVCASTCGSNIFQAGIIDLLLEQDGTVVFDGDFTDMKPCQTGYLVITLTATENSNPMDVWKHIFEVTTDENEVTEPEQAWYDEFNGGQPKSDIDCYIHFDMWIEVGGDPLAFDDGTDIMLIPESEGWMLSESPYFPPVPGTDPEENGVECNWIYLGVLDPAGILGPPSITIVQSFHMDATVENWAQSDCLTFMEEFFAQQIVGNPPLPDNELPGHAKADGNPLAPLTPGP